MSIENTDSVEPLDEDLDAFSADFFGQKKTEPEPTISEDVEDKPEEDADAPTETNEEDTLADEDDSDDGEDEEEEETPPDPEPKKKSRFQERIDELRTKQGEAERKLQAALAEIEKLRQDAESKETPTKAEVAEPQPADLNEDGTEKYPLGEFDPRYIRDLTKHTLDQERAVEKARADEEKAQRERQEAADALQQEWNGKLEPAKERYPDFDEKGQELLSAFEGLDPVYGDYLATTLMSLEYGPDVLYYLANNPDEASKIVKSGYQKATISLGRLEARFAVAEEEKKPTPPKVTKAPTPPTHLNKGSAIAVNEVQDDTDDLDAFSNKFFSKKGR